ncbi:MAG TPA: hypothetical protein VEY51_07435 [Chondromyces sp.]|nr:hypothetical protein [Chondromyces sp.]
MKANRAGNQEMPDFKEMSDRVTGGQPSEPMLVIKTNLDPKDITEENPYASNDSKTDEKFKKFFD